MRIDEVPSNPNRPKLIPPSPTEDDGSLRSRVIAKIKEVYDPEIPVNVYDLGLIYVVRANENTGNVIINMTLTSPACPEAQTLPLQVQDAAAEAEGASEATVNLVWEPAWDRDRMSDEAKLALGML